MQSSRLRNCLSVSVRTTPRCELPQTKGFISQTSNKFGTDVEDYYGKLFFKVLDPIQNRYIIKFFRKFFNTEYLQDIANCMTEIVKFY